jgi:antitoxin (DNA-binding transcriptional repressor) of toxin-antitoxin stability system
MRKVKLDEAQRRLPELIEEAASGEDVVISRGDGASFRLVPVIEPERRPRKAGSLKGRIHIADDFDDPLPDFEEYMGCGCSSTPTP